MSSAWKGGGWQIQAVPPLNLIIQKASKWTKEPWKSWIDQLFGLWVNSHLCFHRPRNIKVYFVQFRRHQCVIYCACCTTAFAVSSNAYGNRFFSSGYGLVAMTFASHAKGREFDPHYPYVRHHVTYQSLVARALSLTIHHHHIFSWILLRLPSEGTHFFFPCTWGIPQRPCVIKNQLAKNQLSTSSSG